MHNKDEIIKKLKDLTGPVLKEQGFDLVDIEFKRESGRLFVRFLMDKAHGGINIDECSRINRLISDILDENEDIIPGKYFLEVCSPGIDRPLMNASDFNRVIDKRVKVITHGIIGKSPENVGLVKKVTDLSVTLELDNRDLVEIPYDKIKIAKEEIIW